MKILVISSCSETQKHRELPNRLGPVDFRSPDRLPQRIKELSKYKEFASDMYEGPNHMVMMKGLSSVREHKQYRKISINLYIISTGYGLINEKDVIVPYDVKPVDAIWKHVPGCVYKKAFDIISNYDLVLFLLGSDLQSLQFRKHPWGNSDMANWIFILAPSYYDKLPSNFPQNRVVEAGDNLVSELSGASRYNLRGFVFKRLCEAACRDGFQVFEEVKQDPQKLIEIAMQEN